MTREYKPTGIESGLSVTEYQRQYQRLYRQRRKEYVADVRKRSYDKNPQAMRDAVLRRESDQPLSRPAYRAVQRALKTGKLIKLDECERCGSEGSLEAHHEDYSKPLDVEWLCTKCHGLERRKD